MCFQPTKQVPNTAFAQDTFASLPWLRLNSLTLGWICSLVSATTSGAHTVWSTCCGAPIQHLRVMGSAYESTSAALPASTAPSQLNL
eukprot:985802-Amphidinium_carterae.1